MRKVLCAIALAIPVVVFTQAPADSVSPRAKQLHDRAIVDRLARRHDAAADLRQDLRHRQAAQERQHRHPAHARGRARRAVLLDLGAERRHRSDGGQARARSDRRRARGGRARIPNDLVLATTAADIRRAAAEHKIAALMGMEGGHMIDDDLRQLRELRGARRPLHDADALQEQQLGRLVHRQAGAQRPDRRSARTSSAR